MRNGLNVVLKMPITSFTKTLPTSKSIRMSKIVVPK